MGLNSNFIKQIESSPVLLTILKILSFVGSIGVFPLKTNKMLNIANYNGDLGEIQGTSTGNIRF